MRPPQTIEKTRLRAAAESSMFDSCKILAPTETPNLDGEVVRSTDPTGISETPCGLDMTPGEERNQQMLVVLRWDATIRVPHGTFIGPKSRVQVTKRHGEALAAPLLFEVVSPAQHGITAMRYRLSKVTH